LSTIQDLYKEARVLLEGSPDASLESKVLLLKSLSISEDMLYSHPGRLVSESERQRFDELVLKRQKGMPLAYVVGEKEFWSLIFKISPGVLIPRPETELLVEKVIHLSGGNEGVIIDIGTGCGNIAVSLAREIPGARILATDISARALKIAKLNASRHEAGAITFLKGNLFSPLKGLHLEGKCDFIVSNPPYVSEEEWETLQNDIRLHEPKGALVSGSTGLEIIEKLVSRAPEFLKPGGYLCVEIGCGQKDDVLKLFGKLWKRWECIEDLNGLPRLVTSQLNWGQHIISPIKFS
jgi:release factor glutamine methyltransferase